MQTLGVIRNGTKVPVPMRTRSGEGFASPPEKFDWLMRTSVPARHSYVAP